MNPVPPAVRSADPVAPISAILVPATPFPVTPSLAASAPASLDQRIADALADRAHVDQLRHRRMVRHLDAPFIEIDGERLINFAGNDYLALAGDPRLQPPALAKMTPEATTLNAGATASALVAGYTPAHASAEARIARWKHAEAAVLLPSGYQANHAAVQTFAALGKAGGAAGEASVRFLVDKLAHASLIDAVRGSAMQYRVFPHNHLAKLQRLLRAAPPGQLQVVVTESVFSMDGDTADLPALAALKSEHPFALLLDEAHATGVYGERGEGLAADHGLSHVVDAAICTFSKAAGLMGGAICGSRAFCEGVVNFGRAYIYSTAIAPLLAAQIERSIDLIEQDPWRRQRLIDTSRKLRGMLSRLNLNVPPGDSPIVPVILGSVAAALAAAETLRLAGIFAVAIRPPTVAPNASRLRLTVSAAHTDEHLSMLHSALKRLPAARASRTSRPHIR